MDQHRVRHAVIGGIGLGAYLPGRATADLDLAVEGWIQDELIEHLEDLGYSTLHRSGGFSNHLHSQEELGRLDFVYLRGQTSDLFFEACHPRDLLDGMEAPVPRPEHLIAMKLQAIKNDPERMLQDLADIRALIKLPDLDQEEIRGYFDRHGRLDWYQKMEYENDKT